MAKQRSAKTKRAYDKKRREFKIAEGTLKKRSAVNKKAGVTLKKTVPLKTEEKPEQVEQWPPEGNLSAEYFEISNKKNIVLIEHNYNKPFHDSPKKGKIDNKKSVDVHSSDSEDENIDKEHLKRKIIDENIVKLEDMEIGEPFFNYHFLAEQGNDNETDACFLQETDLGQGEAQLNTCTEPQNNGKTECEYCDYTASTGNDLKVHIRTAHVEGEKWKCGLCDFLFRNVEHLKNHTKSDHKFKANSTYNCKSCGYTAKSKFSLRLHNKNVKNHTCNDVRPELKKHMCEFCDYKATSNRIIERHRKVVHHCDIEKHQKVGQTSGTSTEQNMNGMQEISSDISSDENQSVDEETETAESETCQTEDNDWLKDCEYCDYTAFTEEDYNRHFQLMHTEWDELKCEYCDSPFTTAEDLKEHINKMHESKELECDFCYFKTKSESSLKEHNEIAHMSERYKCDICDFNAISKLKIQQHKEAEHMKLKKYKCEFCSFMDVTKKSIKEHTESIHLIEIEYTKVKD